MMMADDPKKMATLILTGSKSEEKPLEDMDPGLMSAGEEAMKALESKDAMAFVGALKDFIVICKSLDDSAEYEEELEE